VPGLLVIAFIFVKLGAQSLTTVPADWPLEYHVLKAKLSGSLFVIFVLCFGQTALTAFPCSAFFWMFGGLLAAMPVVFSEAHLQRQMMAVLAEGQVPDPGRMSVQW
jgi:hypothetical protein